MSALSYLLYALFIVCGVATVRYLKQKRMRIAYALYIVLFIILLAYLPYVMGSRLMLRFLSHFVHAASLDTLEKHLLTPLVVTLPWFTVSFVVAIVASVAICLAVAVLAVAVYRRVVRRLRACYALHAVPKKSFALARAVRLPQARAARYRFCRYNC